MSTGSESKPSIGTMIGNKKGRPMTDSNIIVDEITNQIYDPELDPMEYKKARKYGIHLSLGECRIEKVRLGAEPRRKRIVSRWRSNWTFLRGITISYSMRTKA
jgi:hypothetical protein